MADITIKELQAILNGDFTVADKLKQLSDFEERVKAEANEAYNQITDGYKYCSTCRAWYKTQAWVFDEQVERRDVCVYRSAAEWGDDEYESHNFKVSYETCPSGHKFEVGKKPV